MQRLTARFLLLFALVGTLLPLALAVAATPPHACCLRKAVHQCHEADGDQRAIRSTGCCNHDSQRAVTTTQPAQARPSQMSIVAQNVAARLTEFRAVTPATQLFSSQSTRAPPQVSAA